MKSSFSFLRTGIALSILVTMLAVSGCSLRKNIPRDKYLLNKVKIKGEPKGTEDDLYELLKQKPNRRVLFVFKPYMWRYLKADKEKIRAKAERKIASKQEELDKKRAELRQLGDESSRKKSNLEFKIGKLENQIQDKQAELENLTRHNWEEPALLDTSLIIASAEQMRAYLFNKGYFNAKLDYEVKKKRIGPRAKLAYKIDPKEPYIITRVDYSIEDSALAKFIINDTSKSEIKIGRKYDGDVLAAERDRLTIMLRDQGYYNFSRDYIYYEVDSTLAGNEVTVGLGIANPPNRTHHRIYRLNDIYVEPEYFLGDTMRKDTFIYFDYKFLSTELKIRPRIIVDFIFFRKGQLYKYTDYRNTLSRLSQLNLYRFIDIQFTPDTISRPDSGLLTAMIRLTPLEKQMYQGDLELNTREETQSKITESTRSMGVAASFVYRNKNIARSALQLEVRPRFALDFPVTVIDSGLRVRPSFEYGLSTGLIFPGLKVPFYKPEQWLRLASQTSFSANYLFENNEDFRRRTINTNLIYQVKLKKEWRVFIHPFDMSLVDTRDISDTVRKKLAEPQNAVLRNLFDQHILTSIRTSFTKNQQPLTMVRKPYRFMRFSIEGGGLFPYLLDKLEGNTGNTGARGTAPDVFGINYYKYVRGELDIRGYVPVARVSNLAGRFVAGAGVPLFMQILPFERRFFVGGANSIRAWHIRELGPGSYHDPDPNAPRINTGDLRLELNTEFRFPIYGLLKGAVFLDAGNIWTIKDTSIREGLFSDSFYKQCAIGTGLGMRFDFNFFVVRLDFALPARLPYGPIQERWLVKNYLNPRWLVDEVTLNIGIGYPF